MPTGWHPSDIKAAVEKAGGNLTSLARQKGITETACLCALRARNIPGERAISEHISTPLWELWPDRWAPPAEPGGKAVRIDGRRKTTPDAA